MDALMKIKTALAEPGLIVAMDVYSAADHLVVGAGTKLTDRLITRLKFYAVEEITVVTPDSVRLRQKPEALNTVESTPEASYVGRIKTSPEYMTIAFASREAMLMPGAPVPPLEIGRDGYMLSADGNILHSNWKIGYRVNDARKFYENVRRKLP